MNKLFQKKLKEKCGASLSPEFLQHSCEAVVRGACLSRVHGEFPRLTGSRYSVAILTYVPFEDAKKNGENPYPLNFLGDSKTYAPALRWIIKRVSTST